MLDIIILLSGFNSMFWGSMATTKGQALLSVLNGMVCLIGIVYLIKTKVDGE